MSVLLEAMCLVIPRRVLDVSYPGATDAFLEVAAATDGVRYAVADRHLAVVSVFDPAPLHVLHEQLFELGIMASDDEGAQEMVLVDMEMGPVRECTWLDVEFHTHGFTHGWLTTHAQGELAVPAEWTPEVSWQLIRTDIRDAGRENVLPLASDLGIEEYLDFRTGEIIAGSEERSQVTRVAPMEPAEEEQPEEPFWSPEYRFVETERMLRENGIAYATDGRHNRLVVDFVLDDLPKNHGSRMTQERRMLITARLGAVAREMVFEAAIPVRLGCEGCPNDVAAVEAAVARALSRETEPYELHVDGDTSTISVSTVQQEGFIGLWRAASEGGFVRASRLGTKAAVALSR